MKNSLKFCLIFIITIFFSSVLSCKQEISEETSYTVTYQTDYGITPSTITVKEHTILSEDQLPMLSSDYYTFLGWYDGVQKAEPGNYKVTKDVTLVAKWNELSYTVTFNSLGGSEIANQNVKKGNKATRPQNPTKATEGLMNFIFLGWYTSDDGGNTFSEQQFDFESAIVSDVVLYAKWTTRTTYIVTFNTFEGNAISDQIVEEEGRITKPMDPTRLATDSMRYIFSNWYTSNDGGTTLSSEPFDFNTSITGNITLYAKWIEIQLCSVTFNTDGGSAIESQIVDLGTRASVPTKPTKKIGRTSYAFLGWYNGETLFDFNTLITSNITLTVHWLEGFVEVEGMTITQVIPNSFVFNGEVKTIRDLYICDHEVTQKEYREYCSYDDALIAGTRYYPTSKYGLGDNYPVYYVSWYDAIVYCNLRSISEGLEPVYIISNETNPANWAEIRYQVDGGITKYCTFKSGQYYQVEEAVKELWHNVSMNDNANGYRLPSQTEWEYCVRGGKDNIYNSQNLYGGENSINDEVWYLNNSENTLHEIKEKNPNFLGLYDIIGNVTEFCNDWVKDNGSTYRQNNLQTLSFGELGTPIVDYRGITQNYTSRISRGCAFASNDTYHMFPNSLSHIDTNKEEDRSYVAGFRVVRSKF